MLMIQCKLYARGGGGGGSQEREVADGADVVFRDTGPILGYGARSTCIFPMLNLSFLNDKSILNSIT